MLVLVLELVPVLVQLMDPECHRHRRWHPRTVVTSRCWPSNQMWGQTVFRTCSVGGTILLSEGFSSSSNMEAEAVREILVVVGQAAQQAGKKAVLLLQAAGGALEAAAPC